MYNWRVIYCPLLNLVMIQDWRRFLDMQEDQRTQHAGMTVLFTYWRKHLKNYICQENCWSVNQVHAVFWLCRRRLSSSNSFALVVYVCALTQTYCTVIREIPMCCSCRSISINHKWGHHILHSCFFYVYEYCWKGTCADTTWISF